MDIPPEALRAAADAVWRVNGGAYLGPDTHDEECASAALAAAAPHLPDYRWQLRAEHLELAIRAATDPNSDRYDDYHWLLNQIDAFPSPSIQRSSSND